MTRREMLDIARRELAHIPDWPFQQRMLRAAYWNMRLNSLGRKHQISDDPLEVITRAISVCSKDAQTSAFEFDRAFFEEESHQWRAKRSAW
jgi:TPP-dependent trihydroxycyclohexane-1,2-dione (THcHDO) dehydratase